MHKKFLSLFLFVSVLAIFVVGSGFSVFYFGNKNVSSSQSVGIEIEKYIELGKLQLVCNGNDELSSGFESQVFFDNDSVYFIRSDNLSKKRDFVLRYYSPSEPLPTDVSVSVVCDVTIFDSDSRGALVGEFINSENVVESYLYSNSLVDYFEPIGVWFSGDSKAASFSLFDGDSFSNKATYSAVIFEDVNLLGNIEESFEINLSYSSCIVPFGNDIFGDTMSPSNCCLTLEGYEVVMDNFKNVKRNSKVTISFRLVLNEA